jgi:hypothetical protein
MLDAYLGKKIYERFASDSNTETKATETKTANTIWTIVVVLILVGIGGYNAYLSWEANTLAGWGAVGKVIFSFFAFLSGISYLIAYFIYKLDLVHTIQMLQPLATRVM